uniref:Uncharacterized protein n=1 Tax=Anguilla anguilla TaxID=7936 RepID=A0A0E9WDN4_ANGAN
MKLSRIAAHQTRLATDCTCPISHGSSSAYGCTSKGIICYMRPLLVNPQLTSVKNLHLLSALFNS